jgi:hypothetical protein
LTIVLRQKGPVRGILSFQTIPLQNLTNAYHIVAIEKVEKFETVETVEIIDEKTSTGHGIRTIAVHSGTTMTRRNTMIDLLLPDTLKTGLPSETMTNL